jgi:hypothetical protein
MFFFPCELLPQIGRCFQNVLPTTRAHVEDSAATEREKKNQGKIDRAVTGQPSQRRAARMDMHQVAELRKPNTVIASAIDSLLSPSRIQSAQEHKKSSHQ